MSSLLTGGQVIFVDRVSLNADGDLPKPVHSYYNRDPQVEFMNSIDYRWHVILDLADGSLLLLWEDIGSLHVHAT